jgi:hypothetical protein
MSASNVAGASGSAEGPRPAVSARARALAAELALLFGTDQRIVERLNDAHHRLAHANDRLWSQTAPDLHDVHWQIHHAFCAYQSASEQRRQLAVHVGEFSAQLTDELTTAGYSGEQARSANVHQLANGTWPAPDTEHRSWQ